MTGKSFCKKLIFILSTSLCLGSYANVNKAWEILRQTKGDPNAYPQVVGEFVKEGLYFASIPFIKEYLTVKSGKGSQEIDNLIDQIVTEVGIMQFEVLPASILNNTDAPIVRYILAKKYFHQGKYQETLKVLNKAIPKGHPSKPFALFLEASALTILQQYKTALSAYEECIDSSNKNIGRFEKNPNRIRQLSINRDFCVIGRGRVYFANGDFEAAGLAYQDLAKTSHVWPEVLFEEAWSSFYQKDYNRTLGKLVTYKAPIMDFIFNPEIEILRALTYLELCLYDDASNVVNDFYNSYQKEFDAIAGLLKKQGKDYQYFYLLSKSHINGKERGNALLDQLLKNITRDAAFRELNDAFQRGREEIEKVKNISDKKLQEILSSTLKESLILQRDLIGAYVRKGMTLALSKLNTAFQGMSFIRLEVLSMKKMSLYQDLDTTKTKRGDIKNLKRNDKQYFWNFNGEFWADELGDYVFSLKSNCGPSEK